MKGIVRAKDLVNEALLLTRRPQSDYGLVFQHLVNGYRELNTHQAVGVKYSKETMDSQRMVDYPDDLVELRYVFIPYHGQPQKLTRTPLVPTTSLMYGERRRNVEDGENEPIPIQTRGSQAEPHNPFGYYMQDDANRWIIFLTDSRTEVVLAYTTSGLSSEDRYIPAAYKEVLINYIVWRDAFLGKESISYVQQAERIYNDSLRRIEKPNVNYDDFVNVWVVSKTVGR